jgi:hypothetical protein
VADPQPIPGAAAPLQTPTPPQTPAAPPAAAPQSGGDTIQLVDRSGAVHLIPLNQAAGAVASGNFGWVHGSKIPVIDPSTGSIAHVASEHASDVLANVPGARLVGQQEASAAAAEKKYGGFGGMAAAAGEGAARGLTAGLSDPAAVGAARVFGGAESAEKVRQHLAAEKQYNPGISMTAELGGAIAPMFFGDEAGVANILGSIPRSIDGAGDLAAQVTRKLVGSDAASLLGRSGQKAVEGAAKAIVEGGLWGAGQEVSSSTLENRELTAENIMASAGHGALLAGAIGGTLSGLEPIAGKALSHIREHTPFEDVLGNVADEQYIRALSPNNKGVIKEMKERFGGEDAPKRIADRIRADGIVSAGDTIDTIAKKAASAETNAVENLSTTVDRMGSNGVRLGDAIDALEARAKDFERQLGYAPAAAQIRDVAKNLVSIYKPIAEVTDVPLYDASIPLKSLLEQRRGLERTINWQTDTVVAQGKKAAGRTLEDAIMGAGERAAKEGGDKTWLADYEAAKRRFAETRFINETATDAATAKLRNRAISPSDYAAGLLGGNIGEHVGSAVGHGLAGGMGGMLMGAVHNQIRQRGNATLAVLFDKLGTFGGMGEIQKVASTHLDDIVSMALAKNTPAAAPSSRQTNYSESRFSKEAERITSLAASSNAVEKHLSTQTAPMMNHAPEVAKAVNQKAIGAVKYLSTKLPANYQQQNPGPTLTPHALKPAASNADMTKFLRAVDAVEDPEMALKSILKGRGGLPEVDVLKNVYPAMYKEAQMRVKMACSSRTKPLPFQTALRLGILFGEATVPALQPDMIQQQMKMYASKQPPPNPGAPKGKGRGSTQKKLQSPDMLAGMFESASQSEDKS